MNPAVRPSSRHGWTARALVPIGLAVGAHMVPSVVSLGQWSPLRVLPGDLCRWRGPRGDGVALTFDDGPDPRTTPDVLDRLDELSLVATFFCLGEQVARHPELVGEIRRRGHQVETHGFCHAHHFARTPRWVRADLDSAVDALEQVGIRPRWFRPPFGQTTGATMVEARRHGLRLVLWSAWGREWDEPDAVGVARSSTSRGRPRRHRAPSRCRCAVAAGLVAAGGRSAGTDRRRSLPARSRGIHPRPPRRAVPVTVTRALFLSGKFGAGHDTLAEACAAALVPYGVESRIVDCMPMLGGGASAVGNLVFRSLLSMTPVYDGFHFSQLRGNGLLGRLMDRAAVKAMLPKLEREVESYDAGPRRLGLCHRGVGRGPPQGQVARPGHGGLHDGFVRLRHVGPQGTDLFLVTSELAAASVRRYHADARVAVVEAPVRPDFYAAPSQAEARASLKIPDDVPCVLLMSGAWGLGPLDDVARALALEGWWVLAVSGTNESLAARLAAVSRDHPTVIPFGYTDQVPALMAASDVVVTSSGDTCREARVIGRRMVLLDVVPGHGRENLMHELELGDAAVCLPTPASVVGNVRRLLDDSGWEPTRTTTTWGNDFIDELETAGIALRIGRPRRSVRPEVIQAEHPVAPPR